MDLLLLYGEFVVVGDLLPNGDRLPAVDDNLALPVNLDHLGVAVGLQYTVKGNISAEFGLKMTILGCFALYRTAQTGSVARDFVGIFFTFMDTGSVLTCFYITRSVQ